jgi:transposase-like protein
MENSKHIKNWGISLDDERKFWDKYLLNNLIEIPEKCKYCDIGVIKLRNNNSLVNPYLAKCNFYKCNREQYLRKGTIFEHQNKTPASVLYYILELWINDEFNGAKIKSKLKEKYKLDSMNIQFVYKFLQNCRIIIANYMRTVYTLEPLSNKDANDNVVIDESLFTHEKGNAQWVVGLINLTNNQIRLEIVERRDTNTLQTIIEKHVMTGNNIYTDSWNGYNFLSFNNSGYNHIQYNHSAGHFGVTSRIEGIWGELKHSLKKIYSTIRSINFVYFLREIEYRRMLKPFSKDAKMKNIAMIFSSVGNENYGELLSDEDLKAID